MMYRKSAFSVALCAFSLIFFLCVSCYALEKAQEESDQQINDFSLAGYGEQGKKSWDLSGKSAEIFTDTVKLNDIIGNLYGKQENTKLTADKGDFNKVDGKVHLEKNVVITTSSGTKMTTDSLDWDRKAQLMTTKAPVNVTRDNMILIALGAQGEPTLKKIAFDKDVKLDINPSVNEKNVSLGQKEKVTITCDGPLEINYEKNIATFNNNVKVEREDSVINSDKMDVYFAQKPKGTAKEKESKNDLGTSSNMGLSASKIEKIVARGNVKVTRGENVSYSDEATYSASDKKLILSGRPKLILYSTGDLNNASTGN